MSRGFTLTELLIVISIIGILSLITFPYYHSAKRQLAVQRAASKLAQDIRRAQEMAMSVKRVDSPRCFDASGEHKWPDYEYGFGIQLSTIKRYKLYADCNGDKGFKVGGPGTDEDFELFLVDLINVESIYIRGTTTTYNYFDIVFIPPDPSVFLVGRDNPADSGTYENQVSIIISAEGDPSKTKTVTINKAGLVVIE